MPRNAVALRIPLNDEPIVEVIDDIDACDLVYADPIDMIEEEFCHHSPDGTHTYRLRGTRCVHCGMLHPSVRSLGCGLT